MDSAPDRRRARYLLARHYLRLGTFAVSIAALSVGCSANKPPPDEVVASMLHGHEAAFLRLRDMLQEDKRVREIASWGIRVADSPVSSVPPNADMSLDRYQTYHALLTEVQGLAASRSQDPHADPCVLVWAAGWGAGWGAPARHVNICWLDDAPEAVHQGKEAWTYHSIAEHWYVQRD